MKKRALSWLCALAVVLGLLPIAIPVYAKTASEVFETVSPCIVMVKAVNAKSGRIGSGVVLAKGLVATSYHVVEGADRIQVVHRGKAYTGTLQHGDRVRDACTLLVKGLNAPAVVMGSTSRLKVGARVYAVGAPQGLELTLSEGIVSSFRPMDEGQVLQFTAPISPGSSGGGLFDENARLIGLPTWFLGEGQQLNFAVPVEWLTAIEREAEMVSRKRHAEELRKEKEGNAVSAAHPGWEETVKSKEFTDWIAVQPNDVKAKCGSWNAADAIEVLDLFERRNNRGGRRSMDFKSDWDNIQNSPAYWEFSPDDRAIIRRQWFKENIAPSEEFQSFSPEDQDIIRRAFLRPEEHLKGHHP